MEYGTIRKLVNKPSPEGNGGKPSAFGFIRGERQGDEDLFFLPSTMAEGQRPWEELAVGQNVSFVPINHPKGRRATEVKVA